MLSITHARLAIACAPSRQAKLLPTSFNSVVAFFVKGGAKKVQSGSVNGERMAQAT